MFTYDDQKGGIFCPAYHLAPWPGFIMRRQAILDQMKYLPPPGKFIEIGYGSGIILYEFYLRGFTCSGYDFEEMAAKTADAVFNSDKRRFVLKRELTPDDQGSFDCLGAFEVLEHIEDDAGALAQWSSLLKTGGLAVFSVPARMKYWGYSDDRSGHIRRYERSGLVSLLERQGFQVVNLISYGFPFTTLTRPLFGQLLHKREYERLKRLSEEDRSKLSGISRTAEHRYGKIIPYRFLVFLSKLQRLFYWTDWGQGYVAVARKADGGVS